MIINYNIIKKEIIKLNIFIKIIKIKKLGGIY